MTNWFDELWHRRLGRPYLLKRTIEKGRGQPVILLHGIGRTRSVWRHVVEGLNFFSYRIIAFDLLGFGASPKPAWPDYNIDDHARAVIASLNRMRLKRPAIIVGHSMGALVAVRVAKLRPDIVKHLVLYEMPLYEGLPNKRSYRLRTNLYYRLYERIMKYKPVFDEVNMRRIDRLARKITGLEVTEASWQPFIKSLRNTIMKQTAAADIKGLKVPMDVIYGRLDMLVIRGKPEVIFGADKTNITAHTIRAQHEISKRASRFLVQRITAADQADSTKELKARARA
jgi:cis-3-alkyl-4-acyloxetan-2-one decarboxylase